MQNQPTLIPSMMHPADVFQLLLCQLASEVLQQFSTNETDLTTKKEIDYHFLCYTFGVQIRHVEQCSVTCLLPWKIIWGELIVRREHNTILELAEIKPTVNLVQELQVLTESFKSHKTDDASLLSTEFDLSQGLLHNNQSCIRI